MSLSFHWTANFFLEKWSESCPSELRWHKVIHIHVGKEPLSGLTLVVSVQLFVLMRIIDALDVVHGRNGILSFFTKEFWDFVLSVFKGESGSTCSSSGTGIFIVFSFNLEKLTKCKEYH